MRLYSFRWLPIAAASLVFVVAACSPAASPGTPAAAPTKGAATVPGTPAAAAPTPQVAGTTPMPAPAKAAVDFPTQNITLVNPFPAGNYETQSRLFAPVFQSKLPRPVQVGVENVPGGGGVIGYNRLVDSAPDGHTLSATSTHSDAVRKFDQGDNAKWVPTDWNWLGGWFYETPAVGVRSGFAASSWDEFVQAGQTGRITFATPGKGTLNHGQQLLLGKLFGLNLRFIHYASTGEARTALARGEVDAYLAPASTIAEWVNAGEAKWIVILRQGKDPLYSTVPVLSEINAEADKKQQMLSLTGSVRGWITNKGVPADRLQVLRETFWAAANDPQWADGLQKEGIISEPVRGEQVQQFVAGFWPQFQEDWKQVATSE